MRRKIANRSWRRGRRIAQWLDKGDLPEHLSRPILGGYDWRFRVQDATEESFDFANEIGLDFFRCGSAVVQHMSSRCAAIAMLRIWPHWKELFRRYDASQYPQ